MIFQNLSLENFRVFNGSHQVELSPRRDGLLAKPVILFGGLNGAGKTSILTAIRIALLGRKAVGNVVTKKDFHSYLNEQINKKAIKDSSDAIAKISLEFTHTHQGEHSLYRVERSWSNGTNESLTLYKNSERVSSLASDQVQSFLHELVPPGIGDLFFFDGEKIAELAEDDTGSYLKEAVQKLLGIDVINRLSDDLDIYVKQISQKSADVKVIKEIELLEKEKRESHALYEKELEYGDEILKGLTPINNQIAELELKIQERGGAWAKTKNEEKAKADDLIKQKTILETQLLNELDGTFPLALAPNALSELIRILTEEKKTKESLAFSNKLDESLAGLESIIESRFEADSKDLLDTITNYFGSLSNTAGDINLDVSDSDFNLIQSQNKDALLAQESINELTQKLSSTELALESVSVNIQRAPDEEELASLYANVRDLDKQKHTLRTQYSGHLTKAKSHLTKALELAKKLEKLYSSQKTEASIANALSRVDGSTKVLEEFSEQLTQMRVSQLEELFEQSYRKLARKGDLKLSAKIDPNTFDVTLVDIDGIAINRKSMSAGEKQIFAFAILEALGKLSGKVLPVVVDTPLGRLDSKHRDKLVRHYFPEASEQVILLSTDTEVDEDFFDALSHDISHAYEIEFDQKTKCSTLSEGYFWNTNNKLAQKEAV